MSSSTQKRLIKQFAQLKNYPVDNCQVTMFDGDLYHWRAKIHGYKGSPYEGGVFEIQLKYDKGYPVTPPPNFRFLTKIYNPYVFPSGQFCLSLQDQWSPAITTSTLLKSFVLLLNDIQPDECPVQEIKAQYLNDFVKFEKTAKEWTSKYAKVKH